MNITEAARELDRQDWIEREVLCAELLRKGQECDHLRWVASFLWEALKEAESTQDIGQLQRRLRAVINIVEPKLR